MSLKTKTELKTLFTGGTKLTESKMHDLVDSTTEYPLGVENPRISGVSAPVGVRAISTDGKRWVKVGDNNTDWEKFSISVDGAFEDVDDSDPRLAKARLPLPSTFAEVVSGGTYTVGHTGGPSIYENYVDSGKRIYVVNVGYTPITIENFDGNVGIIVPAGDWIDLVPQVGLDGVELGDARPPVAPLSLVQPLHIQNNLSKLRLSSVTIGQEVLITEEANRLEKYMGPIGGEESAGVTVSGLTGPFAILNGSYLKGTDTSYLGANGQFDKTDDGWELVSGYFVGVISSSVYEYPWEYPWYFTFTPSSYGTPLVTRNDVASDTNWEVIGANTFELEFDSTNYIQNGTTVNGVSLMNNTFTNIGWVKQGEVYDVVYGSGVTQTDSFGGSVYSLKYDGVPLYTSVPLLPIIQSPSRGSADWSFRMLVSPPRGVITISIWFGA